LFDAGAVSDVDLEIMGGLEVIDRRPD